MSGSPLYSPIYLNKDLKVEYSLLEDIVSKPLLAKAGAFDKVTTKKFMVMVVIVSKINIKWSNIIFKIFTSMVKEISSITWVFHLTVLSFGTAQDQYGGCFQTPSCQID